LSNHSEPAKPDSGLYVQKNLFGRAMAEKKIKADNPPRHIHEGSRGHASYNIKVRAFLTDLRCGSSSKYLMTKYNLDAKKIESLCAEINRPELTAVIELWERGVLTETQFQRAFSEVQDALDSDD
jgi:hypothetical protein